MIACPVCAHCCYVRQTTASCCYKLELMLEQYNWLLHSCTERALSKAIWGRPRALPLSVNILHPPQLTAIATATLPPSSLEMCCHYCAPLFSLSAISMEIFDPRKLLRCHSSLVEQARCARGGRCWRRWRWRCTKIWRNYTTRPLASLIHELSHFFNLFLTFHNLLIHLSALFEISRREHF